LRTFEALHCRRPEHGRRHQPPARQPRELTLEQVPAALLHERDRQHRLVGVGQHAPHRNQRLAMHLDLYTHQTAAMDIVGRR
jgi:hypothetical protein